MEQTHNKKTSKPYSPEFRDRAVRLAMEHREEYRSEAALFTAIASKLGCSPDSLRVWVRQANEILKKASAYFAQAELDRPFRK